MSTPVLESLARELHDFATALEAESAALAGNDMVTLGREIAEKERLARNVSMAWSEAVAWLRGQSTGGLGQELDVPASVLPEWQAIVDLARRTDTLNRRNGQMIDALLNRTRGALEVLQAAARPVHLYGADGHMLDLPGQGHTLDKV